MIDIQELIDDCMDRQVRWGHLPVEPTQQETAAFVRQQAFALLREVHELVDTINWKMWVPYEKQGERLVMTAEQHAEAADVFFFLGNILGALGMTSTDVAAALRKKREVIESRHESRSYQG